jgi:hypothetical protein
MTYQIIILSVLMTVCFCLTLFMIREKVKDGVIFFGFMTILMFVYLMLWIK